MEISDLKIMSANVRKDIIKMLALAGTGHPGGSLSSVELLVSLYFKHMKFNPKDTNDQNRDYFILSKGHVCPVLYAVLAQLKCFNSDELCTLRRTGSKLQGHPAKDKKLPGIEVSTGSLGYGLSIGAGIAVGMRQAGKSNRVYVLMGDGGCAADNRSDGHAGVVNSRADFARDAIERHTEDCMRGSRKGRHARDADYRGYGNVLVDGNCFDTEYS